MKGLFGYEISENEKPVDLRVPEKVRANPMIAAYGAHPEPDKKCKDCKFLIVKKYARNYYKCAHRGDTNGPGTDHRKHWPACRKHQEGEQQIYYGR